jgi:hypothetical protein
MEIEEMFEQWMNGNIADVIKYIFGQCRKAQLVAFARMLSEKDADKLVYLIDLKENT